jgi:hypothetical protein
MWTARTSVTTTGWLTFVGLFFSCFSAPAASSGLGPASMDIECVIRVQSNNNFLQLDAVVQSGTAVTGEYKLSVSKQSVSGVSRNDQNGTFALTTAGEQILTTVTLDRSAQEKDQDHYQARLALNSDHGRTSCTSP